MNQVLQDVLGRLLVWISRLASPLFEPFFEWLGTLLASEVPLLGTAWVIRFEDPIAPGRARPKTIDARLHQFGNWLWGTGTVHGEPGDPFEYRGVIRRNVFYGSFRRKNPRVLAGTGTFVLKILADSRRLVGRCTWYDSELDDVWSSDYVWNRRSSG